MAFDAGFLSAVIAEIKKQAVGGRIEKVYQPRADEIVLQMRGREGGKRLLFRCGASDARVSFTENVRDNPAAPPSLCMLLRKHLGGAILSDVRQEGFERVAVFEFKTRDEMGFDCKKLLIAEIMGKNSNLIFANEEGRIITSLRTVDFTTSRLRQILPGMRYELPPTQEGKSDPLTETAEGFISKLTVVPWDQSAAKFINQRYFGIAPVVAREIVFRAVGDTAAECGSVEPFKLWQVFSSVFADVRDGRFVPCAVYDGNRPAEYSFLPLTQYPLESQKTYESFAKLLDTYFGERDRAALVTDRASDLKHTVSSAISRVLRKIEAQNAELADCEQGESFKRDADLIVANIYRLKKGDGEVRLTDYGELTADGGFTERTIKLDTRLTPSENAQKLYKKYNKCNTARRELTHQLQLANTELNYLYSVRDALSRAETGADLAGIRHELETGGYLKQKKGAAPARSVKNPPLRYITTNGYEVLCGRNNLQNEEITFKLAAKDDYWFHAKGVPGSHVLMRTNGEEPPALDMTEAAEIAAFNSTAEGNNIPVDYALARHIKKPSGGKPGLVIYHTNYSAYVTPDAERVAAMRRK